MTLTSIAAPTSVVAKVVRSNRSWWGRVLQRETKRDECDTTLSDCRPQPTTTTSYYIYNIVSMNIKIRKLPSPKGPSVAAAAVGRLFSSFSSYFTTRQFWLLLFNGTELIWRCFSKKKKSWKKKQKGRTPLGCVRATADAEYEKRPTAAMDILADLHWNTNFSFLVYGPGRVVPYYNLHRQQSP